MMLVTPFYLFDQVYQNNIIIHVDVDMYIIIFFTNTSEYCRLKVYQLVYFTIF